MQKKLLLLKQCGLLALTLSVMLTACKKNDTGYYAYENQENSFPGSTYEYLASKSGVYDSLLKAVHRVDWIETALKGDSITLFALTNNSFRTAIQNLNLIRDNQGKPPLELNTVDAVELDSLLSKYLAKGYYATDSLLYIDGASIPSLNYHFPMHGQRVKDDAHGYVGGGPTSIYYSDTKGSNFVKDWSRAQTQAVNIRTSSGILHVLSNSHEFGFGEFSQRMNKQ